MRPRVLAMLAVLCVLMVGGRLNADQPPATDPEVLKGIKQVDNGEFDGAILTLDAAVRRLATEPAQAHDLSVGYLYLGIAYVAKGHEAAARAKFREALKQAGDLSLSPEKFAPKIINAFEAARAELGPTAEATPSPRPTVSPTPSKGGGSAKWILIGGGVVAAGGAAVALSSKSATPTPTPTPTPAKRSAYEKYGHFEGGNISDSYTVGPASAGRWEAQVSWTPTSASVNFVITNGANASDQPSHGAVTESQLVTWQGAAGANYKIDVAIRGINPTPPVDYHLLVTYPAP